MAKESGAVFLDCAQGGGQVFRTALALSTLLKKPVELENIRKNRPNPGIQAQHLAGVKALEQMGAKARNAQTGAVKMFFQPPEEIGFDSISLDVGTAGSVTLVMQTLFLPLAFAKKAREVSVTGGTHVNWSPSTNYFEEVFLPQAKKFGVGGALETKKPGFYPQGGGLAVFKPEPCRKLLSHSVTEKGGLEKIEGESIVSGLPVEIAERQKKSVLKTLAGGGTGVDAKIKVIESKSPSPGTFVFLKAEYEHTIAGFGALGEKGKPAEAVGGEAARKLVEFHHSPAGVDDHLADQLIPLMALAEGKSEIKAKITEHVLANISVCEQFLPVKFLFEPQNQPLSGAIAVISVEGAGFKPTH